MNRIADTPAAARVEYPSNRFGNVAELVLNELLDVTHRDEDAPGVLLKLGEAVLGGVGPNGDIVGFSTICPLKCGAIRHAASCGHCQLNDFYL